MRLSELISGMGLWVFPVVGLLGFLGAFLIVLIRVGRTSKDTFARQGALPLSDGEPITPASSAGKTEDHR